MVDVEKLANRLAELASAPEVKRKKIAVVRDLFDSITAAMSRGVRLDDIVREMRNDGIEIDKRGLSVTLSKIRVERGELKAPRKSKTNYLARDGVSSHPLSSTQTGGGSEPSEAVATAPASDSVSSDFGINPKVGEEIWNAHKPSGCAIIQSKKKGNEP